MAEGARLESVYTATYRGFESLTAIYLKKSSHEYAGFFFACCSLAGDEILETPALFYVALRLPDLHKATLQPSVHTLL